MHQVMYKGLLYDKDYGTNSLVYDKGLLDKVYHALRGHGVGICLTRQMNK